MKTIFALILSLGFVTSASALPNISFYQYQGNGFSGVESRTFESRNRLSTSAILSMKVKMQSHGDSTTYAAVITGTRENQQVVECKVLFSSVAEATAFVAMVREADSGTTFKCVDASTRPQRGSRVVTTVSPNETRL